MAARTSKWPLLIRSITSTTWGLEAWPQVKPVLRRALEMRRQDRAEGLVELNARGRRLRAALAAVLIRAHAPELALVHRWLDSWSGIGLIVAGMTHQGFQVSLGEHGPASGSPSSTAGTAAASPSRERGQRRR